MLPNTKDDINDFGNMLPNTKDDINDFGNKANSFLPNNNGNTKLQDDGSTKLVDDIINIRTGVLESLYANTEIHRLNDMTSVYYAYDLQSSGAKYLVSRLADEKNLHAIFNKLSDDEVDFQLLLSKFLSSLSKSQQVDFSALMDKLNNLYVNETVDRNPYRPVCRLPSSEADVRRMYTEGALSIAKQLPIPNVTMLENHSYVSIKDIIADFLLRNNDLVANINNWDAIVDENYPNNPMYLFRSKRVCHIIKTARARVRNNDLDGTFPVIPIFVSMWSDDFDPNKSIKSNRQSVWIKTITIFVMNQFGNKIKKTYPISKAKKGLNHQIVEKEVSVELEALRSGKLIIMFSRAHRTMVYVHSDIYCIMNDQPERRSNLKLAGGNSTLHGWFGVLLDCKQKAEVIRSCKLCSKSIKEEVENWTCRKQFLPSVTPWQPYRWRTNGCKECTAWMYNLNSPLLYYLPEERHYPERYLNSSGKLKPMTISKTLLENSIETVHSALIDNKMTKTEAKCMLKYSGFNTKTQELIIVHAENCKRFSQAFRNRKRDPTEYVHVKEDKKDDVTKFEKYKLPYSFYHFNDLTSYVPVPMHLFMLGITKSVLLKFGKFLRNRGQNTIFLDYADGILEPIKDFNLEWCKILGYPASDKWGGWVSENFLAMVRISLWFFSLIDYLPEAEPYKDPTNSSYKRWNGETCRKWLGARGMSKQGKAADLRLRVAKCFQENSIPPVIIKNDATKQDVQNMIHSMNLMIHVVMSTHTTTSDITSLEAIIRQFLIDFDVVDKGITVKDVPSWISQYNFLSLLDVPKTMEEFGNVRNLWEGGTEGEGYLREVKKELKAGLIKQWQTWSITNLLKNSVYSDLISSKNQNEETKITKSLRNACKIYRKYKNAFEQVDLGVPISGVMTLKTKQDEAYYICYRAKGQTNIQGIEIILSRQCTENINHLEYYQIDISNETTYNLTREILSQKYTGVLLLPQLTLDGYQKNNVNRKTKYCIIKSDWS